MTSATDDRLNTDSQACDQLGSDDSKPSPRTLERWRTIGYGPKFVKIGRRVYYRQSDIDAWVAAQVRTHTGETR